MLIQQHATRIPLRMLFLFVAVSFPGLANAAPFKYDVVPYEHAEFGWGILGGSIDVDSSAVNGLPLEQTDFSSWTILLKSPIGNYELTAANSFVENPGSVTARAAGLSVYPAFRIHTNLHTQWVSWAGPGPATGIQKGWLGLSIYNLDNAPNGSTELQVQHPLGPYFATRAVPEPNGIAGLLFAAMFCWRRQSR